MITIHIEQDDAGAITVSVDDGEPIAVEGAEQACQVVEQALGAPDQDDAAAFEQGYSDVRGGGMNAPAMGA